MEISRTERDNTVKPTAEFVSCMDGEAWFNEAADLYQFHANELRRNKEAILGQFQDDIDSDSVPDPGVVPALISADPTWKSRNPVVVAELPNGQYLSRVFNLNRSHSKVEFLILDSNRLGKIIFQFEWSLSSYWSIFGSTGYLPLTSAYLKFVIRTSAMKNFAIIVGPSEDIKMPSTKLLYNTDKTWQITDLIFESEKEGLERSWPVNVIFHPQPDFNQVVFLQLTTIETWVYGRTSYPNYNGQPDTVCKYNVESNSIIVKRQAENCISDKCFDIMGNGDCLVLLEPRVGGTDPLVARRTLCNNSDFGILFLDTDHLETTLRITHNFPEDVLDVQMLCKYLPIPFLSLCKSYFAMLFWMKPWRRTEPIWDVATFKVYGFLRNVLTLKQIARIAVLRSTKVNRVSRLPIPKALKDYLID